MNPTANEYRSADTITPDDPLQDYPENLIINRPDLKSKTLILGEKILTLAFWGFWFYLWLPLISLIAWLLGFRILYTHMIKHGGFDGFMGQLDTFTTGVLLFSGTLALWSFYNLKRYGTYSRRNKILATDLNKLTKDFSVTTQDFNKIQQAKRIAFSFNVHNEIRVVKTTTKETT